jgi:hypothetical protein
MHTSVEYVDILIFAIQISKIRECRSYDMWLKVDGN